MDEKKVYNIRLADGSSLKATADGAGNYIINGIIEKGVFSANNLNEVVINDGRTVLDTLYQQVLRTYYITDDNNTFIRFSEMTELEKIEETYNAKLDYIACMTGVDLDE